MNRREFVRSAAAFGLVAGTRPFIAAAQEAPKAGDAGIKPLKPPAEGLINVAFAISRGTTEIDYVGPQAVFETWYRDAQNKPAPRFKLYTVSETREPVDGRIADFTFETAPAPHIIVIPAQRGSDALIEWLRKTTPKTDVTMSVCVGAAHLAKAGLLKGLSATSHHEAIEHLTQEYPDTKWVRGVRFVENERVSTGGGLTAGIDLALHVVERYFGRPAAQKVAEHLEYECRGWQV